MADEPRRVGRYEIVREVGRGGMALVYLARQTDLNRDVALKELAMLHAGNPAFAARFLQESQTAGSLTHPNIVTVHEYFEHEGTPYIAMEYMPRGSLRPLVGNMSLPQIAGVFEGLLSGLAYAESLQIIHRDLKPENLMLSSAGTPKITDFGIAKAVNKLSAGLTATGTTVGTPTYMAPEQAMARELSPATDLYSVGVMAYEMLVGHVPFHDTDTPVAILLRNVNDPIPPPLEANPNLDPQLAQWTERLLVKDPKQRTQTAAQAWDELEEIVIGLLGPRWRREARLFPTGEAAAVPTPPAFAPPPTPPPAPEPPAAESPPPGDEFATFGPTPAMPATPVDADPVTNDAAAEAPTAPPDEVFATFEPIAPPPPADPGPPEVPKTDAPVEQVTPPPPPAPPPEPPPPTTAPEPPFGEPTLPPTPVPGTTGGESFQWPTAEAGKGGRGLRPVVLVAILLALIGGGVVAWLVARGGSSTTQTDGHSGSSGGSKPTVTEPPGPTFFLLQAKTPVGNKEFRSLATDDNGNAWAIDYGHMRVVSINNGSTVFDGIAKLVPGTKLLAMAYAMQALWLVDQGHQQLVRITTEGQNPKKFPIDGIPISRRPVFVDDRVWIATGSTPTDSTLTGFDLTSGKRIVVKITFKPTDLTANSASVYAIGGGKIVRVDSASGTIRGRPHTLLNAQGVFANDKRVWVAIKTPDRSAPAKITQLDPTTLAARPLRLSAVPGSAETIAEVNDVLWVALHTAADATAEVVELDPEHPTKAPTQRRTFPAAGRISKPIFDGATTLWMKTGGAKPGFTPYMLTTTP